ncbi:MAG TPA: zinc-dependent metalloprotease [Candidatus Acidoferrales bacterium]|nr:zinc-dependent metalloprotease [Candidatus Acidoferrales bacterium]
MLRSLVRLASVIGFASLVPIYALAQSPPAAAPAGSLPPIPAFAAWTKDAQKQSGLIDVWRKDGKVYLELRVDQLNKDFLETAVPANGLGGFGIVSGQMFQQEARLLRFERVGRTVAMVWPQTLFTAVPNTPLADAVRLSTADSVMGMAPIVAENEADKSIVVDLSALLGDVMDFTTTLKGVADPKDPLTQYHLDPSRTYFGSSKAFPSNVVIETDETFASAKPPDAMNTVVDPRSIQMRVVYNIIALPENDGYMPRLYDDRVGFWEDPHARFDRTNGPDDFVHYVTRWNLRPSDPTKPISPAIKPIVYTLSNSIPIEYRDSVRRAILEWNKAFERIGISNAVQVQDQPNDPNWDPDDVRYNVIRWITEETPSFGAEAQIVWDPRTGEILRSGVIIENILARGLNFRLTIFDQASEPAAKSPHSFLHDDAELREQFAFGAVVQALETGRDLATIAQSQAPAYVYAVVLHEVGHDWGLAHNFIGHEAYTRAELRSKEFTSRHGLSSSVMDYSPVNLAPPGKRNGDLFPTTIGPYDYHAIAWGYGIVPGASTPEAELPRLRSIASAWTDPRYRFASDEDTEWSSGHAVDPRVQKFLLSNDELGWCNERLSIVHGALQRLDSRFPQPGHSWDEERAAFASVLTEYDRCTSSATHYIGGEYLSRSRVGDVRAELPLTAVSRNDERRAFAVVNHYLFANDAWNFSPMTLRRMVYSEHEPELNFGYKTYPRFDVSVSALAARFQDAALAFMYSPLVLQRIADLPTKNAAGTTMSMTDLFTWNQNAIFGDLNSGAIARASSVRRNLQRRYTALLAKLAAVPAKGTPYDAQALARYELGDLETRIDVALRKTSDLQTHAHLEAMRADAARALRAREVYQQAG